jgi:hypothetical protein
MGNFVVVLAELWFSPVSVLVVLLQITHAQEIFLLYELATVAT